MNWGEIKRRVHGHAYHDIDEEFDNEDVRFPDAANIALTTVCTYVVPLVERYTLSHTPIENLLNYEEPQQHTSQDIIFKAANPASYYFECDGNGSCVIEEEVGRGYSFYNPITHVTETHFGIVYDEISTITLSSNRKFVAYSGALDNTKTIRLRFTGNYAYTIRNVGMFPYTYSATDLPVLNRYLRYDMVELTRDNGNRTFLSFADDNPVYKNNQQKMRLYDKYYVEQDTILLPYDDSGEFTIFYKKLPPKITSNTLDAFDLGITEEAGNMLTHLIAYYMLLDDDKALATYHYNAYERLAALHQVTPIISSTCEYEHAKGWV